MTRLFDVMMQTKFTTDFNQLSLPLLREAKIIVADNVAHYYFEISDQEEWALKDFPNIAPPFENFFIEWRGVKTSNRNGEIIKLSTYMSDLMHGIHFIAIDLEKQQDDPNLEKQRLANLTWTKARWQVNAIRYFGNMHKAGDPTFGWAFFVDNEGKVKEVNEKPCAVFFDKRRVPLDIAQQITDGTAALLGPALITLSFMHCKNVIVKTIVPPIPLSKKHKNKTGNSLVNYKILEIEPMKRVLRAEGYSEKTGLKMAMHICRGHFKDYTQHGLFGKVKGVFWWEAQVRGKADQGIVTKDYGVNQPQSIIE